MKETRTYYVYLLASRSRNLYVGITSDLRRRVWQHQHGQIAGFTRKYKIHRLVHFELFNDVRDAIRREKQIKAWRRAKKVTLISRDNPTWQDLSADWHNGKVLGTTGPSPRTEARARDDRALLGCG